MKKEVLDADPSQLRDSYCHMYLEITNSIASPPRCFCKRLCEFTRKDSRRTYDKRGRVTKEALAEYTFDFDD